MKLTNIQIKNFRLLKEVDINLSDELTVVVGRNNSGKTSLTELFYRLLSDNPVFRAEDFSLESVYGFWTAFQLFKENKDYSSLIPEIQIQFIIDYSQDQILGTLSPFIIDLNTECFETKISAQYHIKADRIEHIFNDIDSSIDETTFNNNLNSLIRANFTFDLTCIDINDEENFRSVEFSQLKSLLRCGFINAQRGLNDDTLSEKRGILASILEKLFINTEGSEDLDEKSIIEKIEKSIENVQETLDGAFKEELGKLFPAFNMFGYPGLSDPNLITKTTLDAKRLLSGHTSVNYAGSRGIDLPENYNGLGSRNLIYILLQLYDYFKEYKNSPTEPGVNIIFIEEPEAHLHPQMQEVFTDQLKNIVKTFSDTFNEGRSWPIQFVLTTHSSHIANRASFKDIQYFLTRNSDELDNIKESKIKDLKNLAKNLEPENEDFLHKYLTLTNCDLFFADKVVLIEGTAERLFLPLMIQKAEETHQFERNLSSQYTAIIEVGGAYSHLFFPLLDFLEIPSLIITDIDSVKKGDNNRNNACIVSEGETTSNTGINTWAQIIDGSRTANITIDELLRLNELQKIIEKKRLAFQIPQKEQSPTGRSLEESFILANHDKFSLSGANNKELEIEASDLAKSFKKSDFALKHTIKDTDWIVPKYIEEGIVWLANQNVELLTNANNGDGHG
ncbi:MAG: ATP-dependent endonuclease [Flavobacteriaceae bacterium]|nr:ATP-dependent endonuclease [Flavobacteriaceae bacterium]|tara:strand:- start:1883 stop:3910 length:2028 start_codon:yes stop_codon:yes gene_type:complete